METPAASKVLRRVLRGLILAEVAITALGVILISFEDSSPTHQLQNWTKSTDGSSLAWGSRISQTIDVAAAALLLLGWVALWKEWRFGRRIFTCAWVGLLASAWLGGPVIQTSLEYCGEVIFILTSGVILGLLYFSDLRHTYSASVAAS